MITGRNKKLQIRNLLAVINLHSVGKFTRLTMMVAQKVVTPAKAGVQGFVTY